MSSVVFLRAANVGGKNVFRPAQVVAALGHLGAVNVGAAGTFLIRQKASAASIRRELLALMPFEPELTILPAREVLNVVGTAPFDRVTFSKDQRGWVAVLASKPKVEPRLPLLKPEGKGWSVRLDRIEGPFALGLWRRTARGFTSPNLVVETALGVRATTRWWETMERIAALIEEKA
jgi:uncharacterized protein (DUF1697 family)